MLLKVDPDLLQKWVTQDLNRDGRDDAEEVNEVVDHLFPQLLIEVAVNQDKGHSLVYDWGVLVAVLGEGQEKGRHEVHGEDANCLEAIPGSLLQDLHYGVCDPSIVLGALDDARVRTPEGGKHH